jgi:hypothetical protein
MLLQNLISCTAGGRSIASRDVRTAARLILALMRQAHPSDVFRLLPDEA